MRPKIELRETKEKQLRVKEIVKEDWTSDVFCREMSE